MTVTREQRSYSRLPIDCGLTYVYNNNNYRGQLLNISKVGLKFRGEHLVPPLSRISVTLLQEPPLTMEGLTIWSSAVDSLNFISLKFENLTQEQQYALTMLLSASQ